MPQRPDKQVIEIDFGDAGIDNKTQSKMVAAPHVIDLQNARINDKLIAKRNGTAAIGGTVSANAQKLIATDRDILAAAVGNTSAPVSSRIGQLLSKGPTSWTPVSPLLAECNALVKDIQRGPASLQGGDSATVQNSITGDFHTLVVWEDGVSTVGYSIINRTTGARLVSSGSASGAWPKCVAIPGTNLIMFGWFVPSLNQYLVSFYNANTGTVTQTNIGSSVAATNPVWDVTVVNGLPFMAYYNTTGTALTLQAFSSAGVAGASTTITTTVSNALALGVADGGLVLRVFWFTTGTGIRAAMYNTSLVQTVAPYTIIAATGVENLCAIEATNLGNSKNFNLYAQITGSQTYNRLVNCYEINDGATIGAATTTLRSVGLGSKPVKRGLAVAILLTYDSTLQSTYFLYQYTGSAFYPCAKVLGTIGGGLTPRTMLPFLGATDLNGKGFAVAVARKYRVVSSGALVAIKGISEASFAFPVVAADWIDKKSLVFHNGTAKLSGGFLSTYDGNAIAFYQNTIGENGFFVYPEAMTIAQSNLGGFSDGTYQVVSVYERYDSAGNLAESYPGVQQSITISAGAGVASFNITYPTYRLGSALGSNIQCAIYISDANTPNVLYRAGAGSAFGGVLDTGTFLSGSLTNATLITGKTLYTTGGVLPNLTPDGPTVIFRCQRNVITDDPNDDTIARFSKLDLSGAEMTFADPFTISIPSDGGHITAGIELDTKAVFFKLRSIYVSYGSGLTDTGVGQGFSVAQRIRADIGCLGPNLLCEIPSGILFRSEKGIYLLGRDLNVTYAGEDIEAYNSALIRSWVHVKDANEVRIALDDDSTVLVYNYERIRQDGTGRWMVYKNYGQNGAATDPNGVYTFTSNVTGIALAYKETPGVFSDNHIPAGPFNIVTQIKTPWYKFANLAGFMRIWKVILSMSTAPVNLKVEVAYDFEEGVFSEVHNLATPTGATVWQPWFRPIRSRCQAMQLRITDSNAGTSIAGDFQISGLTFECGVLPGAARLPPGNNA